MNKLLIKFIQLLPITPASEQRDTELWVEEMLPIFAESCLSSHSKNQNIDKCLTFV